MTGEAKPEPAATGGRGGGSSGRSNPFRRNKPGSESASATSKKTLEYEIGGRHVGVSSQQYACYEKLWREKLPVVEQASLYISEDAAADLIHQSDLTDDDLAELWDAALAAKLPTILGRPEYRLGFIDKVEFFVLLSELQAKLEITIDVFYARFGHETVSSIACSESALPVEDRNNPFGGNVGREVPIAPLRPSKAPIDLPATEVAHEPDLRAVVGVTGELLEPQPAGDKVDGIDIANGSLQDFRISLSGIRKDEGAETYVTAPKNATLDVNLPIPVVPIEIVYSQSTAPTWHLTGQNASADAHYSDLIHATPKTEGLIPVLTHFSGQKEVVPSIHELEAQTPQSAEEGGAYSRHRSSLPATAYAVSQTGTHELEALLSTKESDKLAIERLEALKRKGEQEKRDTKSSRTSITSVGKSIKNALGKDVDKSASGYSLKVLAEALEAAASEGNVPLLASLLSLGANAAYSSIKNQTEHAALAMAAEKGHTQVVDVLIPRGSTQRQIDSALIKACHNGQVDLAITLVQKWRANIYPKRHVYPARRENKVIFSLSCFDGIAYRISDPQARMKLLECFMRQKTFEVNKIVLSIYHISTKKRHDLTALALFVNCGWIKGVQALLAAGASVHGQSTDTLLEDEPIHARDHANPELRSFPSYKHSVPAICSLSANEWKRAPNTTLAICRALISAGSTVDITHAWTSDGQTTSPLATAIAGGSLEGTDLLLAYGANPEAKGAYAGEEYSALGIATRLGRLDIVRLLVSAGALAWKIAHAKRAALYIACEEGWLDLVEYLLDVGGKLNDKDGEECLCVAARHMRLEVVGLLMRKGATRSGDALEAAMALPPVVQRLPEFLILVDMLLDSQPLISPGVIFEAINADNHVGLARILASGKGKLAFGKDELCRFKRGYMPELYYHYNRLTCLNFARILRKTDFVRLLESYGFKAGSEGIGGVLSSD